MTKAEVQVPVISKNMLIGIPATLIVTLVVGATAVILEFANLRSEVRHLGQGVSELNETLRGDFSARLRDTEVEVGTLRTDLYGHYANHPSLYIIPTIEALEVRVQRLEGNNHSR